VVGVHIVGVPGDHRVRLPQRDNPGYGQSFLPPSGQAGIGKVQEGPLSPYHLGYCPPVPFADLSHFPGRQFAKVAGHFATGQPENFGRIPALHMFGQGTAYTNLVVGMRKNGKQSHSRSIFGKRLDGQRKPP